MTYNRDNAVDAGAKLLDAEVPGWWNMVVPERLDLASATSCVLGQIFDSYMEGAQKLFGNHWAQSAQDHGFFPNLPGSGGFSTDLYEDECAALTLEWSYAINERILAEMLNR